LASICFHNTATRILSLSQSSFTTQVGMECCVSNSTKTPRKRATSVAQVACHPAINRECPSGGHVVMEAWVVVYKIKSLGLLGHVSFRMDCSTSTSCLSNGSSCRDLPCLSWRIFRRCRAAGGSYTCTHGATILDGSMRQKSTHLKVNFLLICFQQLFAPDIATQRVPLAG
jgi:hypothetical protein